MICTDLLPVNICLFVIALIVLLKGCDYFVESAAALARKFNTPEIIIGLTLVSLGTSLPELATDVYASLRNESGIVFGDIIGSNIANIALVLGIGVFFGGSMKIPPVMLQRDGWFMLGVFITVALMCYIPAVFGAACGLGRISGMILVVMLALYLFYLFRHRDALSEELEGEGGDKNTSGGLLKITGFLLLGLVMVLSGSRTMVDNVVWGAEKLNISKAVIASTIVAFGTSVPELAVTITGIVKKRPGIALGNIIGSCIFNILLILGVCSIISPLHAEAKVVYLVIPVMLLAGGMLIMFMHTQKKLVRWEAVMLLILYFAFITKIFLG